VKKYQSAVSKSSEKKETFTDELLSQLTK